MNRVFVLMLTLLVLGCSSEKKDAGGEQASAERVEADYITVQHVLIAFAKTIPGKQIDRTRDEAEALANDVFRRAKAGEDFDGLVRQYSDDAFPGIYKMANNGISKRPGEQMFARGEMVKRFGDVGFSLDVGEIGMAEFHATGSQFGWHIVKRIE